MGKKGKGKSSDLGRALMKNRFGSSKQKRGESMLHTADINDGYQWDRLNLSSVTEESSFQEFLSTAQLAGTEFHAEKLNIKYVNPQSSIGLLSDAERAELLETHKSNEALLKIPRRPKWNDHTTAHELQTKENEEFLEWRRQLAVLQEAQGLTMTPYEKNLEFWRQLWRVVERSDVIVQIVDARNPLLFRCEDLERYVKEVDADKTNMILINKADFLTTDQRQAWCDYFTDQGVRVAFFSALAVTESQKSEGQRLTATSKTKMTDIIEEEEDKNDESYGDDNKDDNCESENESEDESHSSYVTNFNSESEYESAIDDGTDEKSNQTDSEKNTIINSTKDDVEESKILEANSPELLTREMLISLFKSIRRSEKNHLENVVTIGLVGYPNVGKSSTINAILADKKVSVSATPGKTKHFQTLYVDKELLLCDCPGLVMPSFICTKAEMVLHGILPIDQLRDHVPSVTLLGTWIPRHILEDTYGIMLPSPMDGEDPDRPPTAEEILNTYGYNRGFMTQNGQPDNPRSARYILKDFVTGKLLYCVAPPDVKQSEFHKFPPRRKIYSENRVLPPSQVRASRGVRIDTKEMDKTFFQNKSSGVHMKGLEKIPINPNSDGSLGDKPWKKINKHANKKKHEKLRRLYRYLDIH
ncbi:large subunit GTPase 1 homolog [Chelonus insularis]|uniref:large subunit GTPase 1 homolog n=1 Tax=Chelonus insularis TaxID=460826 RepID=UPI00158ECD66|nr:large subunit GTPase 1 homolog [Chelonus insularis]